MSITIGVASDAPTHRINPLFLGCHSDSGFVHQVRGFHSQLLFGESFEEPQPNVTYGASSNAWNFSASPGVRATSRLLTDTIAPAMHGASSRTLEVSDPGASVEDSDSAAAKPTMLAALRNRGLANEGLYLRGGRNYEGYFFARCAAPVTLVAQLEAYDTAGAPAVLAQWSTAFACGATPSEWVKLDFELTPASGTDCVGIAVGSDPNVACTRPTREAGHSCVRCAGQFAVGLGSVGSADLDYVFLQPGEWGRVGKLPVRKEAAETLRAMGTRALRVGGSFASVTAWPDGGGGTPPSTVSGQYYQWQRWTGPPWKRPSVGAVWNAYSGGSYSLIGGWGPFEVVDMCAALGIEPIITTTSSSSASELADLVEYCWADPASSALGRRRAADGHPEPYRLRYIELGNEQYNTRFVAQVGAMEERARALGLGGRLRYIFPQSGGLRGADVAAARALGIDAQIVTDIHVGASGAIDEATNLFRGDPAFRQSAVNLEVNAGSHTHGRALLEAADLNAFLGAPAPMQRRVLARTASFCMERSGHFDAFDQGLAFFLPNASWLQPPGHVHAMIAASWLPNGLNVTLGGVNATRGGANAAPGGADARRGSPFSVSAQRSDDGSRLAVRFVSAIDRPIGPPGENSTLSLALQLAAATRCASCRLTLLSAGSQQEANPSWEPGRIAPVDGACELADGGNRATVPSLEPFSYNVVQFEGCTHRGARVYV